MNLSQLFSRLTWADVLLLVGIAFAIGTGLHLVALKLASKGWKKTANALDAVAAVFLNGVSIARKLAAATGRDMPVMTVAQTIAATEQRVALASVPRQPAPPGSHGFATARSMALAFLVALLAVVTGAFAQSRSYRARCVNRPVASASAPCPGGHVVVTAYQETPFGGRYAYGCQCPSDGGVR